jgi:chemotaxis protein CheD
MASIDVSVGQVFVGKESDILTASGIGSCVVVSLYDRKQRTGAMAHALLPSASTVAAPPDAKYVDAAIDAMIAKLVAHGADKEHLAAKIVGGANMFANFGAGIGIQNVAAAREKLKAEGITVLGECVGGGVGRSVKFDTASGLMSVIQTF